MDFGVIGEGKQDNALVPSSNKSEQSKENCVLDTLRKLRPGLEVWTPEVSMEMYKQCCSKEILYNEISAYPNYLEFFNHSTICFSDKV